MKKIYTFFLICLPFILTAQNWEKTASTPDGMGITALVVQQSTGYLFASTASIDWPNGEMGGIRRSMDDGATWENVFDAYNGRTITEGSDGFLYASVWDYPLEEGLYRSTDDGQTWEYLIAGAYNIFSIAVDAYDESKETIIYLGTSMGVYRSLNNGYNWEWANNGIEPTLWIRSLAVDSNSYVAAGTTDGLLISNNYGESWVKSSGGGIENSTVSKVYFTYDSESKAGGAHLIAGTSDGVMIDAFSDSEYLVITLMAIFETHEEISDFYKHRVAYLNTPQFKHKLAASRYPTEGQGGGFSYSEDNGATWQEHNNNLPENPKSSALTGKIVDERETEYEKFFMGLFDDSKGGASVYSITFETTSGINNEATDQTHHDFLLFQNQPNPVLKSTTIDFELKSGGATKLSIIDRVGNELSVLENKDLPPGLYSYKWERDNLPAGLYYFQLKVDHEHVTKKLILK